MQTETLILITASRRSHLAVAQVEEVLKELNTHYPWVQFSCIYIDTIGDKDQTTSLRSLEKTDFFTKELDALLLSNACRIAIHSAKDLPEPLPKGLALAAVTNGIDPSDALVLNTGKNLSTLPAIPIIATSSLRREEAVRDLIPSAHFIDIRGTVNKRLQTLDEGKVDGVVVAEAALIRLGLTRLNRIRLRGPTTALQGQLAVVVRSDDEEMLSLFSCLDSRIKKRCS